MAKIEKRYQMWGREGITWSPWFTTNVTDNARLEPWQLKSASLKNEYQKVDDKGNITPIKVSYSAKSK